MTIVSFRVLLLEDLISFNSNNSRIHFILKELDILKLVSFLLLVVLFGGCSKIVYKQIPKTYHKWLEYGLSQKEITEWKKYYYEEEVLDVLYIKNKKISFKSFELFWNLYQDYKIKYDIELVL